MNRTMWRSLNGLQAAMQFVEGKKIRKTGGDDDGGLVLFDDGSAVYCRAHDPTLSTDTPMDLEVRWWVTDRFLGDTPR